MNTNILTGKITFINHEKQYATIEYIVNEKKKTINGNISEQEQLKLKAAGLLKHPHHFHIGDEINFITTLTPRGDKMMATNIRFLFNNALGNMINKAATDNQFMGYLKKVGDEYFVKETGNYIFFPLLFSPWEVRPADDKLNEPVFFQLDNISKAGKATASLCKKKYIPAYHTAMKYFNNKTIIDTEVYKVTPHSIFLNLLGNNIQAKINVDKNSNNRTAEIGSNIKIIITHLGGSKIVVEEV